MPDGTLFRLRGHDDIISAMRSRDPSSEIIVDGFCGGGGSSEGVRTALGRSSDEAVNHDTEAVSMHTVNHPATRHHCQNIWTAAPADVARGRPIGLAWFSAACTHFSKARNGKPKDRSIRDLAWVVVAYAKLPIAVRPRVIMVENVEEFVTWGPLDDEGRRVRERDGETFKKWTRELRRLGYAVDWWMSRACDFGAPTIRKRFILVARCDGRPIVRPAPTHGDPNSREVLSGALRPWRTAAEIIDWSIPGHSIFLTRDEARAVGVRRPLADTTLRRIGAGIRRYVLDSPSPFIAPITAGEPTRTITAAHSDTHPGGAAPTALVAAYVTKFNQNGCGGGASDPMGTAVAGAPRFGVVSAYIDRQFSSSVGHGVDEPAGTVTAGGGGKSAVVAAFMAQHNGVAGGGVNPGRSMSAPLSTIGTVGANQTPVAVHLATSGDVIDRSASVHAFLVKYYGAESGQDQDLREALHTVTTRDRFGLVTVEGVDYVITDITIRMLRPRELYDAMGFPHDYIIDRDATGKPLSQAAQIRMCGNAVSPPWAAAIAGANVPELARAANDAGERRAVG